MRCLTLVIILVLVMACAVSVNAQVHDYTTGNNEVDLVEKGEALRQERAELEKEYERIQKEKVDLGDPPAPGASAEDYEAYNRRAEDLNQRIEKYQEKLEDHERRVEEYNARFEE